MICSRPIGGFFGDAQRTTLPVRHFNIRISLFRIRYAGREAYPMQIHRRFKGRSTSTLLINQHVKFFAKVDKVVNSI
ncbi:hypothetical protein D320_14610 [Haloferax sp. BAB-2207]|nr:hypothetical protein D320_14610 [Haloferax sp. BAB-2207]